MDAEEKRLSRNAEADAFPTNQGGFRLHCFPDIPADGPDNARVCALAGDKFQRIRYAGGKSGCLDISDGGDETKMESDKASGAADSSDVPAYQQGFKDGFEKGTSEGEQAGFDLAARKLEPLLDSLKQGIAKLKKLRRDTFHGIEKEVVALALAIARKVICREIEMDKEVVVCVAREALTKVDDPGEIKIKMNSSDLQLINETKHHLSELIGNIDHVTLEAEDNIQSGGCVIQTNMGEIDARIEKQLQAVEESFQTALEKSISEG